jgi:hypothetical protein
MLTLADKSLQLSDCTIRLFRFKANEDHNGEGGDWIQRNVAAIDFMNTKHVIVDLGGRVELSPEVIKTCEHTAVEMMTEGPGGTFMICNAPPATKAALEKLDYAFSFPEDLTEAFDCILKDHA